mmetsp:Transcript_8003/g.10031  ORF Transcript_8003/g.10031 Transcript_8003/m.10031 type:complete len:529 (+) Transcript_8003:65-1651(+)
MADQVCDDGPVGTATAPQQENLHYDQRVQEETAAATTPAEPQSLAKRRAAARRARIMKKSSERLSAVGGLSEPVAEESKAADSEEAKEDGVVTAEGGAVVEEAPKKQSAGSRRMQQMRNRRFKKNAAADEPAASEAEKADVALDEKADKTEEPVPKTEAAPEAPAVTPVATKKKYMGVAKMRRKMLQDQKNLEEATTSPLSTSNSTHGNVTTNEDPRVQILMTEYTRKKKLASRQHWYSRMLELVVVAWLFYGGFHVGYVLHDQHVEMIEPEGVAMGLSVREGVLLQLVTKGIASVGASDSGGEKPTIQRDFSGLVSEENDGSTIVDEFDGESLLEEILDDGPLDPIFRLHLDVYTRGPSFLMMFARMAVYIHRSIVGFFLLPLTLLRAISSLQTLPTVYPLFFLLAVGVRQGAAFGIENLLGLSTDLTPLEDQEDEDDADGGGDGGAGAVKALASFDLGKTVKGFVGGYFPRVITVWDVLSAARGDMYVVSAGLLLGLALPFWLLEMEGQEATLTDGALVEEVMQEL